MQYIACQETQSRAFPDGITRTGLFPVWNAWHCPNLPRSLGEILQLPSPFVAMDTSTYPMATFAVGREVVIYDLQQKKEMNVCGPRGRHQGFF